ncbi:MAG: DNA polymerase III subunit delta [Pseudomonadota bacterium]|nr:DNA polymerase III subunit delta [Pseudomonadota bacterium]
MKLRHPQLGAELRRGLAPVYLVTGDEPLLCMEAADLIRTAARAAGCTERNVLFVEPGFDWSELSASASNLSLFATRSLVELRLNANKLPAAGANSISHFLDAGSDNPLLITAPKLERSQTRANWYKRIESDGAVVEIWPLHAQEMQSFLQQRMNSAGLAADAEAVALLAERVEGNLLAAVQEIEKLKLLAVNGDPVTADLVLAQVTDNARFDLSQVSDRALAGDAAGALRSLEGLIAEGVEPILVLWTLNRELSVLAQLKQVIARSGGSIQQAISAQRPPIWKQRQQLFRKASERLAEVQVNRLLCLCADLDAAVKGASDQDPLAGLRDLVLAMSHPDWPLTDTSCH